MRTYNLNSTVSEFVLLGFPMHWPLNILFFLALLIIFMLTLMGNLILIALVFTRPQLRTPMYFFLCNLSILEILLIAFITPKMLENLLSDDKTISFWGCMTQCYFYFFLGTTEFALIAIMSFDRYIAICHPFHYAIIMNDYVCGLLALVCWLGGILLPLFAMNLLFRMSFCGPNVIDHFFCDYAPLVLLACTEDKFPLTLEIILADIVEAISFVFTLASYLYIITTILRIPSTSGRQKAFSTCTSHITVASIFYGSTVFLYCLPIQRRSPNVQKAVALLVVVVTPSLNPFIYSLRNEKVKNALRDFVRKKIFAH
ncbi:olfactory receptor 6M1-like [Alligator mississippiensis]|uniref:olfactory receptor 6M1-like n=1 Tax=Alligator mississippiensis TaxID=8496 RepID=UPI0028780367|nr:olfactory receptor 6M1-like [Alligator mississippiensis]